MSDVKLSPIVEQRSVKIQLDYVGFGCSIIVLFFLSDYFVELIDLVDDSDAVATIRKLSWLNNPNVSHWLFDCLALLSCLLLFLNVCSSLFVIVKKSFVLCTLHSVFDMES